MAEKLDPQVQIRIIDLACEWSKNAGSDMSSLEAAIKVKAERFDEAYRAIVKTVEGE